MNKIFLKLGFRKQDEMETTIALKSIKLAWAYTVAFLICWALYCSYRTRTFGEELNRTPLFLLITQNLILATSQFIYKCNLTKVDSDDNDENINNNNNNLYVVLFGVIFLAIITFGIFTLLI